MFLSKHCHLKYLLISALPTLLILATFSVAAQSDEKIDMFREEIKVLEQRIDQAEAGKQGIVRQLQNIDRKIELHRRLIAELEVQAAISSQRLHHLRKRIRSLEGDIETLSSDLAVEEADLTELRRQVGERIADMYKHLEGNRLALLIGAADLNDLSQRQHYLKAVARFDRIRLDKLRKKRNQVWDSRQKLVDVRGLLTLEQARRLSELERARRLINSKRSEQNELKDEKGRKQVLLDKIAGDSDLLNVLLDERRRSLQQIEWEIQRLEGHRPTSRFIWQPDVPFKELCGTLPWPLERTNIVQNYGRIRHPELGTTTINPGIDLKASLGDPVYSIARGQVTRIAWLRGFGNTVILSHGDGYYTVYARLGRILVAEGDVLKPGQPIGEVGDSGVEGNFHFEVWSKRNKQDPVKWLR